MVVLSAGVIVALLRANSRDAYFWVLIVALLVTGSITRLGAVASTLAVEKEWVKVIFESISSTLFCLQLIVNYFSTVAIPHRWLSRILVEEEGYWLHATSSSIALATVVLCFVSSFQVWCVTTLSRMLSRVPAGDLRER